MSDELDQEDEVYSVVCHARITDGNPDFIWIAIGRWTLNGSQELFLEFWDARGEVLPDIPVDSEQSAKAFAFNHYQVPVDAWILGSQPFSP